MCPAKTEKPFQALSLEGRQSKKSDVCIMTWRLQRLALLPGQALLPG